MKIFVHIHFYKLLDRFGYRIAYLFPILLLSNSFCIDSGSRWGGFADFLPSSISCCNSINVYVRSRIGELNSWCLIPSRGSNFPFAITSSSVLRPTQVPIWWWLEVFSPGIQQARNLKMITLLSQSWFLGPYQISFEIPTFQWSKGVIISANNMSLASIQYMSHHYVATHILLTLKRGPGRMLLVDPPRVLVRLPFRGFTQIFVVSRSPLIDMFIISAE